VVETSSRDAPITDSMYLAVGLVVLIGLYCTPTLLKRAWAAHRAKQVERWLAELVTDEPRLRKMADGALENHLREAAAEAEVHDAAVLDPLFDDYLPDWAIDTAAASIDDRSQPLTTAVA
jgi:hypothetical protein